jgi:hypothetical protein
MTQHEDFYVGYQDRAPRRLARFLAPWVTVLLTAAMGLAAVLAAIQKPPSPVVFEFGIVREFQGRIRERPYPMLEVDSRNAGGAYMLVGEGKRGAADLTDGLDGREVTIRGTLIYRGTHTIVEVHEPPVVLDLTPTAPMVARTQGSVELSGEIVDAKCHLGAMNPGSGATHRACAIRCLLGGVPPLLVVENAEGSGSVTVIAGPNGGPLDPTLLRSVGIPVRIRGQLRRSPGWVILETDLNSIVRTGR